MAVEHVCKLTLFPEGEAVCLDCGAFYIYQRRLEGAELALYRNTDSLDTCDCGHSITQDHDQYGCTFISCRETCKAVGPDTRMRYRRTVESM